MSSKPYVFPNDQLERVKTWLKGGLIKGFKEPLDKSRVHNFQLESDYNYKPIYEYLQQQNENFKFYASEKRGELIKSESKKIESHYQFLIRTLKANITTSTTLEMYDKLWEENYLFDDRWSKVKPVDYLLRNVDKLW